MNQKEKEIYDAVTFRPQTGLGIARKLEKQRDRRVSVCDLYPILHKLERQGLIKSFWEIQDIHTDEFNQERGGARRRYYQKVTGGTPLQEPRIDLDNFAILNPSA